MAIRRLVRAGGPLLPEEVRKGEPLIKPEGYAIGAPRSGEVAPLPAAAISWKDMSDQA